jgi:hypothetical protein
MKNNDPVTILVAAFVVVGAFLLGIGLVLGLAALQAFLLMLLWNFTMPAVFGLPVIGFWRMWALLILFNIVVRLVRGGKKE